MKRVMFMLFLGLFLFGNAWASGGVEKLLGDEAIMAKLTAAADAGDAEAQYILGRELIEQAKDAKTVERGFSYLERAAKQGHVFAMHGLGLEIRVGNIPGKTLTDAFNWYRKAAEAGFAGAQNNLGDMYETGEGVAKSYGDAIHWYTRAAMQGEPTAYWSLGECYAKGIGVGRDGVQAYRWLLLAVKNFKNAPDNRAKAENTMKEVEQSLTPEQVAESIRLADRFVPLWQTEATIGDPGMKRK
jgi:hypothetical protein